MAQAINLQITPSNVMPKIYASQFDIGREIEINLYDGASAYTPPVGTDIRFEGKKPDGNGFSYACTYTGNVVTVVTTDQMTVLAGEIPCELRMSLNGNDIGTLNIIFVIERSPIDENVPISDTEIPAIVELARDEQYTAEAWATGERNGVPVGPTDPQYHNNAKYWAEHAEYGALDDLTDVEITTPTDGDLLQYNSADDEWENSHDVWDTMAQNGAHNLLRFPTLSELKALNTAGTWSDNVYTFGNATFTVDESAETVTVNCDGTSSAGLYFSLFNRLTKKYYLPNGTYKVNGLDNGEDSASYFAIEVSATTKNSTSQAWYVRGINTDGASFTYDDTQIDGLGVTISIMGNHTANNVVVKPMIRLASDPNTSHGLYTMTNRELTEVKVGTVTPKTGYSLYSGRTNDVCKCGNIVTVNFAITEYTPTSTRWAIVASLPAGFRPRSDIDISIIDNKNGYAPPCRIFASSGDVYVWSTANTAIVPLIFVTYISE